MCHSSPAETKRESLTCPARIGKSAQRRRASAPSKTDPLVLCWSYPRWPRRHRRQTVGAQGIIIPARGRALGHLWRLKPGQFSRVPKPPGDPAGRTDRTDWSGMSTVRRYRPTPAARGHVRRTSVPEAPAQVRLRPRVRWVKTGSANLAASSADSAPMSTGRS